MKEDLEIRGSDVLYLYLARWEDLASRTGKHRARDDELESDGEAELHKGRESM
jgi:hypothetical protein